MTAKKWSNLVRGGESLTVEFKRQVPKLERLARSLSAFSNSAGGTIFFGVTDDGTPCGLANLNGTRDLVSQVAQFHCRPEVQVAAHAWRQLGGAEILVVEVPESAEKPVYAVSPNNPKDAWPFFRSDKSNLPLDKKSLKTMTKTSGTAIDIEQNLNDLDRHSINILNFLHDSPGSTLNQLAKSANISPHRAKKLLVTLEKNGWIHGYFNEKRREFSLVVPWKKK